MSYNKQLVIFSAVLLAIKLMLLPFVHQVDADAVTRTYLSLQFAENPHIIKSGTWLPFYFYIFGGALKIYGNQLITPVVLNILFSVLLLFPLFHLLKRMFDEKIAFLLCLFFSLSPMVFRMSLLAMSEMPYIFFVISGISILVQGIEKNKLLYVLLAGMLMGIATGIRYESWLIGSLVSLFLICRKWYKKAVVFALPFAVFPLYWLISNYFNTNDVFNSFNWAIDAPEANPVDSWETFFRRLGWQPMSLIFAFGPIAFYFVVKTFKVIPIKTNQINRILILFFLIFFLIWEINSIRGSLLLQHRFAITLFLFSFPFLGYYLAKQKNYLLHKTLFMSISAILLTYVYSSQDARPVPRLLTDDAQSALKAIKNNLNENDAFICDFWNWETTYCIPFSTKLPQNNIVIIQNNEDETTIVKNVAGLIQQKEQGVLLIKKHSVFHSLLSVQGNNIMLKGNPEIQLKVTKIFENDSILCYLYTRKQT